MAENSNVVNAVNYKVTVVKYEISHQGFAEYFIKVVAPRDIAFHIKDRYSSLRDFQSMIKRQIGSADGCPSFPKKKYIGNMETAFLEQRCQQLSLFLQVFLSHPLVKTCPLVPVYFRGKAHGDDSLEAIQNLI